MTYYERNLPHWHPKGKCIFLTWRLYGSLPAHVLYRFRAQKFRSAGEQFRAADRELDAMGFGPQWLKDPRIAGFVCESLLKGDAELEQYRLYSFVIMPNHVHVLLEPKIHLSRITGGIKGVTAKRANFILDRTGQHFWQDESFDHWVRNPAEFERMQAYIERNPVAAGLANRAEDWPWSSAQLQIHRGKSARATQAQ